MNSTPNTAPHDKYLTQQIDRLISETEQRTGIDRQQVIRHVWRVLRDNADPASSPPPQTALGADQAADTIQRLAVELEEAAKELDVPVQRLLDHVAVLMKPRDSTEKYGLDQLTAYIMERGMTVEQVRELCHGFEAYWKGRT